MLNKSEKLLLPSLVALMLIFTGINPAEQFTWFLETSWVILGLPLSIFFYRKNGFTKLLAYLLTYHALVLIIGGYYTYANVPLGNWMKDYFELTRNNYDRLGHFTQGFVPAILTREVLIRNQAVKRGFWLFLFTACICLSFSAFFEFIEWWTSLLFDDKATAFLGTQGDIWDTQWDMFLCLIGAIISQLLLSNIHDDQLDKLS